MLNKGDIVDLNITELIYGGDGLGKIDGYPVFVPDTAPEEEIKVEIISASKSYARGKIVEIVKPSKSRIKPECPLSKVCGGCQWQHVDYKCQIKSKKKIVEDNLKKIANLEIPVNEVIQSPEILNYRCKVQYPVRQTKVSMKYLAGYFKNGTHEVVNIKYCPVQPEIIDTITEYIREKLKDLNINAYNEKTKKGMIRHIVYRYSKTNNNLLVILVVNDKFITDDLKTLCLAVKNKFRAVAGVLLNFNRLHSNVISGSEYKLVDGKDHIVEIIEGRKFKISAGSFFQVNPLAATGMFNYVHKFISDNLKNPAILDLYAGVGSFAIWNKNIASKITAIEENSSAIEDAIENIKLNSDIDGAEIEIIQGNAEEEVLKLLQENHQYDVTILDPPRKGCSQEVLDAVVKLTEKYIIYVSCNPATLARDLKFLSEYFIPEHVQPVDMFCHTHHIESITVLRKI
jgi:23S rRNA (uracil1939-C5)-methyltransferase